MAYGAPALPMAALGIPVHVHLPAFYAEDMGLGLTAVGGVLLVTRLFDVCADPVIGLLCDRGLHRRKVWLALSLPLLALSGWRLFMPAAGVGAGYLALWSALFYFSLTAMMVPYLAWGVELSPDYTDRTRVSGWREIFGLVGVSSAIILPAVAGLSPLTMLSALFPPVCALLAIAIVVLVMVVPETESKSKGPESVFRNLMSNRPFRRLVTVQSINAVANALPATLFLMYVGDVLASAAHAGLLLVIYFAAAVLSIPIWLSLSQTYEKHLVWGASLAMTSVAFLPAVTLHAGQWPQFAVVCVGTGLGLGADLTLPPSMLADAVDEHLARSGDGRAGLYAALWSLTGKVALALAVGVAFPILHMAGYVPKSGTAPLALPLLYAGVPILLKLSTALLIKRFTLDRARHSELRRLIALQPENIS